MKNYAPDPDDMTIGQESSTIPSAMEQDTHADEEVISQHENALYPEPVDTPIPIDDLSNSIAYALDGSGPGPTGHEPMAMLRKPYTEETTSPRLEDEEDTATEWRSL